MPKPTFFNLAPEKRQRLIEQAIIEFSERSYRDASLSRIVARTGIAKGSLYQYFEHKLDLYRWLLLEELPRRKREHMQTEPRLAAPADMREALREMVLSGLEFMRDNPRLALLGMRASSPTTDPELAPLFGELQRIGHEGFLEFLRAQVAQRHIRADLDLDVAGRVVASVLGYGVRDLLLGLLGVDVYELLQGETKTEELGREKLLPVVDATVGILMEGLAPKVGR